MISQCYASNKPDYHFRHSIYYCCVFFSLIALGQNAPVAIMFIGNDCRLSADITTPYALTLNSQMVLLS